MLPVEHVLGILVVCEPFCFKLSALKEAKRLSSWLPARCSISGMISEIAQDVLQH